MIREPEPAGVIISLMDSGINELKQMRELENNDPRQIQIRRYRNVLSTIGRGIILFSLWSVAKTAALYVLKPDVQIGSPEQIQAGAGELSHYAEIMILIAMLAIDLAVRMHVGRSAIALSNGRHRRSGFLILAGMMAVGNLLYIALVSAGTVYGYKIGLESEISPGSVISGIVIEITSLIMTIELIITSQKLRKITGKGKH